jgi:hypothetical protein
MSRYSPKAIRDLGFEWPHSPAIEESAFVIAGEVDLLATLGKLQEKRDACRTQVNAAQKMKADTGADHSDLSDRYDELASTLFDLEGACNYVQSILAALPEDDRRRAPGGAPPPGRGAPPVRYWGWLSILVYSPWPVLVLLAVVFGAIGAGFLAAGLAEGIPILTAPGIGFISFAVACVVWLFGRGARMAAHRSRELARDAVATPRRRRIMIRVGIVFGVFVVFVIYNWIVWYGIHEECTIAWDAEDRSVAQEHILRAAEAADNPLLLLPSDLFDLHGPGRCRSAAHEHGLPRPD